MKTRSRAGGEPVKARPRKALKRKGGSAPKAVSLGRSSVGQTEVARLTRERDEALEQQAATAEVLKVISSSPGELRPVFEAMLKNAVRICGAKFGNLWRCEGSSFRITATHGAPRAYAEYRRREPIFHPAAGTVLGRLVATRRVVHIADVRSENAYAGHNPSRVGSNAIDARYLVELASARTVLAVPMIGKNKLIGAIIIYRQEVQLFTEKQIELVQNFANQGVIAIENARLLNELRQRTTDLTQRTADLSESLEQQTATSEVLQVISSSPGDLQPVFEAMLEKAVRICDAKFGNIYRWDGSAMHLVAAHNTPLVFAEARRRSALFSGPKTAMGRMVETNATVHIIDAAADEAYLERDASYVEAVELAGVRTLLVVPLLKDNGLMGAFTVYRQEVRPFAEKQIELVENFAAQAGIAIENTRLLNELRQRTDDLTERTAELTESLEQQTATSEVLKVVSSSPGDLQPVFDAMLENAVRICEAKFGILYLHEGGAFRLVAARDVAPGYLEVHEAFQSLQCRVAFLNPS
jgi:GAF domain-containing protein